jgi:hypothetical protein
MSNFNFCDEPYSKKCIDKREYCGPTNITILPSPSPYPILSTVEFYSVVPSDPSSVLPGEFVRFPKDGPSIGTDINRNNSNPDSIFTLGPVGIYQVSFQVPIEEDGALQLRLNNDLIASTLVRNEIVKSQIVGISLIRTIIENSILRIENIESATTLTLSGSIGRPNTARVVITLLSKN